MIIDKVAITQALVKLQDLSDRMFTRLLERSRFNRTFEKIVSVVERLRQIAAVDLTGAPGKYSYAYRVIQRPLLANYRLIGATAAASSSKIKPSSWHATKKRWARLASLVALGH